MRFEDIGASLRISALIVFPLIIPVYIHDLVFNIFVIRGKYVLYFIITVILVLFFGYIIAEFQGYFEPGGRTETYASLVLIMLLYSGVKFLRISTQQRIRLKQEEEKRMKVEIELKELEAKQASAELNLLKSQVNPHFLFNSLNSIYSLILKNSDIAGDAVLKLSDLMRYLLESSQKRKVLVQHEFDFLQNYIDLEKIRLGKKAKVKASFEGDLSGKIISPLLLITFVENCFKHGISVNLDENNIIISVKLSGNTLVLHTSNYVAPIRINPSLKKSGTGIENVKKRLELLYPGRHQLDIIHKESMFIVNLVIEI